MLVRYKTVMLLSLAPVLPGPQIIGQLKMLNVMQLVEVRKFLRPSYVISPDCLYFLKKKKTIINGFGLMYRTAKKN